MTHDYRRLAKQAAEAASDKKAKDILVFDLRRHSDLADYVLIAGAESTTQMRAIHDGIEETLEQSGVRALRRDGQGRGRWMALDYGSLVVHVMLAEAREFYRLEHLWESPKRVVWEKKRKKAK